VSTYELLGGFELAVEGYELERRQMDVSSGFTRVTTTVVLRGDGNEGRGEDVTYDAEDHEEHPRLELDGRFTVESFSRLVGALDLFAAEPARTVSRDYRRWAYESAALDLALRQAGTSLGAALHRPYRPVRFAVSTRLDIRGWLAIDPGLEFKLDPTSDWDCDLMAQIAATGRVRVLDFKAYYTGTRVENPPDAALYQNCLELFPDAVIEDAALTEETRPILDSVRDRLSWDAPIHSVADVEALEWAPRWLNIKPSRFGSLRGVLDCIDLCASRGISVYGGGQFELGVGRGHVQALASLFYPSSANDVAPSGYNAPEPIPGLPRSPLAPPERPAGIWL
jgi:L-alanine-DL-glutamate epimerase-like enolase superfamily enzyme